MNMRCLFALVVVIVTGCGWPSAYLPDGGRNRVVCDREVITMPVKVLDAIGAPTSEATVVATNVNDGRNVTGTTDRAGIFKVSSELGPGVIQVKATLNDLATPEGQFTVTPAECTPVVSPNNLVLQLR